MAIFVFEYFSGDEKVRINPSVLLSSTSEQTVNQTAYGEIASSQIKPNYSQARTDPILWLGIALALLSATASISVGISFYLYRWRKLLLSRDEILVPEAWGKKLFTFDKRLYSLINEFERNTKLLEAASEINTATLNQMVETFMTFQTAISERDQEIRRLKAGYDKDIFRRFLNRFIRVHQTLISMQKGETESDDPLVMLRRLLEDAFEECGLEIFEPPLGEDYRKIEGIADNPAIEMTMKSEEIFKITEVIEKGYRLSGSERSVVLIPAKVKVFVER